MMDDPSRKRAPTIIDVARIAGVSVGTVSRYLNGVPVREAKRSLIEGAIAALRYTRNAAASSMRTDRNNLVALLVPGYGQFFGEIVASLSARLARSGLVLLTHQDDQDHRAMALALQFFKDHRVNVVVTPGVTHLRPEITELTDLGIPVIFFNNDLPGLAVDRVFSRNSDAIYRGVQYLVDMGHRRIGFISGDPLETSATERLDGFNRAVADFNLPIDERYIVGGGWSQHLAYYCTPKLLDLPDPPTAIVTANCNLALGVLDHIREIGIQLGEDLSLVSFDDPEIFGQLKPGITSIAQPTTSTGTEIAELVLNHIHGDHAGRFREIRLDCTIHLRESVKRL